MLCAFLNAVSDRSDTLRIFRHGNTGGYKYFVLAIIEFVRGS